MTLDEAKKAMEDEVNNIPVIPHSRLHSAHLLGIEALRRMVAQRKQIPPWTGILLPGETEE